MSLRWSGGCLHFPCTLAFTFLMMSALHLQGDPILVASFHKDLRFWSVRANVKILWESITHSHLQGNASPLDHASHLSCSYEGKPARCWWITSVPCHTFQWIKNYASFIVWESMICVSFIVIPVEKTVLSLEQLLLLCLLRIQCRVTCRLQA